MGSCRALGNQSVVVCVDNGVDPVAQSEFGQNPGDVGLDGFVADVELRGDLGIAVSRRNEDEDFLLAGREGVELRCVHVVVGGKHPSGRGMAPGCGSSDEPVFARRDVGCVVSRAAVRYQGEMRVSARGVQRR